MDPDTDTESECEYYKLARERVLGNLTGSVSKSCVPGPPASVVGGSSSMDTRGTSNSHKPSELDVKDKMGATVRWFSSFDPHHRDVSPESTTNAYTQEIRELERLVFSGKASGVYEGSRTFAIFPINFKAKRNKTAHGEQWENDKARGSSEAFGQKHTAFSEICGRATSDNRSAWHVRHCTAEDGWLGREMPHTAETMGWSCKASTNIQ
jgi:hypothetical protein